ncbi:uncharacterized protein LOC121855630 [Homarus americanus]|nr:uncharacterized protein LOC121855630 [Homarus americanus]
MAKCGPQAEGSIFSSDTAQFEVFGAKEYEVKTSQLCRDEPNFVILPEGRRFETSRSLCGLLNGSLAVPTSSQHNQLLTHYLLPFRDMCVPTAPWKLWLGVIAQQGVWKNMATKKTTSYTNFSKFTNSSGFVLKCANLRDDGFWEGQFCESTFKRCAACSFNHKSVLRLRGLCFDTELETQFRVEGSEKSRPFFRGYYGLLITWDLESRRWQVADPVKNVTLMWATGIGSDDYPLGRRKWELLTDICGITAGQVIPVSLSECSDGYFMCSSGECIAYHSRCNFRYDCQDQSDEVDCYMVQVIGEFQRQMPPTGLQGTVLLLTPELTLSRITSVDDLNMAVTLEFQLTITWEDDRLKFKHLRKLKNGTILTDNDAKKVWRPVSQLMNLDSGQMNLLGQSILVRTATDVILPGFNDVDMDMVYPGSANKLSILQRYSARVTCDFQLYTYPFDIHLCNIGLQLPPEYDGYVRFAGNGAKIFYTGPQILAMYSVKNHIIASADGNQFIMNFELHRRQGVILLTTFVPSGLLLLVSWSTLFVKLEALNVRAVMSLTTLLVLYTLFANISRSLPNTASIKLIDVWFFFIIFVLFTNIVVHIFVSNETVEKRETKIFVQNQSQEHVNNLPKSTQTRKLMSLRYYRAVILPLVVVLFNIIFWLTVFLWY